VAKSALSDCFRICHRLGAALAAPAPPPRVACTETEWHAVTATNGGAVELSLSRRLHVTPSPAATQRRIARATACRDHHHHHVEGNNNTITRQAAAFRIMQSTTATHAQASPSATARSGVVPRYGRGISLGALTLTTAPSPAARPPHRWRRTKAARRGSGDLHRSTLSGNTRWATVEVSTTSHRDIHQQLRQRGTRATARRRHCRRRFHLTSTAISANTATTTAGGVFRTVGHLTTTPRRSPPTPRTTHGSVPAYPAARVTRSPRQSQRATPMPGGPSASMAEPAQFFSPSPDHQLCDVTQEQCWVRTGSADGSIATT